MSNKCFNFLLHFEFEYQTWTVFHDAQLFLSIKLCLESKVEYIKHITVSVSTSLKILSITFYDFSVIKFIVL